MLPGAAWVEKDASYTSTSRDGCRPPRAIRRRARRWKTGRSSSTSASRSARRSSYASERRCAPHRAAALAEHDATPAHRAGVRAAGTARTLAAGLESVGALEVGLHVPGPAAGEVPRQAGDDVLLRCRSRRKRNRPARIACRTAASYPAANDHAATSRRRLAILVDVLLRRPRSWRRRAAARAQVTPLVERKPLRPATASGALRCRCPKGSTPTRTSRATRPAHPRRPDRERPRGRDGRRDRLSRADRTSKGNAPQPLSVFEREFVIGARAAARRDRGPGRGRRFRRLRYQACDEKLCFIPTHGAASGRCPSAPPAAPRAPTARSSARSASAPAKPPHRPRRPPREAPARSPPNERRRDPRASIASRSLGTAAGYLDRQDFLEFIHNAENGVVEKGWFEAGGRSPSSLDRPPRRPRAEPDAVRAADDPDQPGDHRRRRAGGIARRGFLLGATYGGAMAVVYGVLGLIVILTAGTFGTINASPWFNLGIAVAVRGAGAGDVRRHRDRLLAVLDAIPGRRREARHVPARVRAWARSRRCSPAPASRRWSSRWCCSRATSMRRARPRRWRCRSCWASAWRCRGRSPAPASPRCRSRAPGWSASSRPSASFILVTAAYYGYSRRCAVRQPVGRCRRGHGSVAGEAQGRLALDSLDRGLAAAERERKPVLIDFWATWCKNCLTMDKTTLADPEVGARWIATSRSSSRRRVLTSRRRSTSCSASTPSACPPTSS